MAALSDYLENKLLDHMLGTASFTMPSAVYVALYTSDPTDADTGTEVSGGGYARQELSANAASGGSADNSADIVFPEATASWGTITHVGIRDALTGGNLLLHGALDASKAVGAGEIFRLPAGDLTAALN